MPERPSWPRTIARFVLGGFLLAAGAAHLLAPELFLVQVPAFLPARELIVLVSGVVELALGAALLAARRWRVLVGWAAAAFFVAIVPGNIGQAITGTDGFGLGSDLARWLRVLFQPLFVVWALWCTGAWSAWRSRSADGA